MQPIALPLLGWYEQEEHQSYPIKCLGWPVFGEAPWLHFPHNLATGGGGALASWACIPGLRCPGCSADPCSFFTAAPPVPSSSEAGEEASSWVVSSSLSPATQAVAREGGRTGRAQLSPPPRANPARPARQRRQLTAAGGSPRRGGRRLLPHDGRLDALQHWEALPHGRPPLVLFQAGQDLLPCGQKRQGGSPGPPSQPGDAATPGKRTRRGCPAVPARQRRHGHGR